MSILTITNGQAQPYILLQSNVPMFLPSSGSIGNNGALTLSTALDLDAYSNCYLYFPANAIVAGSAAGLYYTQMSSATVGTIYNNTYTNGKAEIPSSPTAFATTGPGAYTQTTATDITLLSFTLPGGAMGANGSMFIFPHDLMASSVSNKLFKAKVGGSTTNNQTLTTVLQSSIPFTFRNKGVQNRNIANGATGFATGSVSSPIHTTVDNSADQTVLITANLAAATDYLGVAGLLVQINPSA